VRHRAANAAEKEDGQKMGAVPHRRARRPSLEVGNLRAEASAHVVIREAAEISGCHCRVRRQVGQIAKRLLPRQRLELVPVETVRNWEQGRSHPDAPTRVLLAVIAKHPEAVEDVLRKAS